jgi:hypothetical protein
MFLKGKLDYVGFFLKKIDGGHLMVIMCVLIVILICII